MSDPDLSEAKAALEELSQDPVARRLAEERWLGEVNYQLSMAQERREGREEGRVEGREEGRTEALREAVARLCHALGIELTDAERSRLSASSSVEVQGILEHVTLHRSWPG